MELTTLQKAITRYLEREQKPVYIYQLKDELHHPGVSEACESLELNDFLSRVGQGIVALPEKTQAQHQ